MKRIAIYALILASALMVPLEGTDVGRLKPVGLVQIYREGELCFIVTDTGDYGTGKTAAEAFDNLEKTTSGVIFLDTADYLLIDESVESEVAYLRGYLKHSVRICEASPEIEPEMAQEYLQTHRPTIKLKEFAGMKNLEKLRIENGRLILIY